MPNFCHKYLSLVSIQRAAISGSFSLNGRKLSDFPVLKGTVRCMGTEKFLHVRILFLDRLNKWIRANSLTDCTDVYIFQIALCVTSIS